MKKTTNTTEEKTTKTSLLKPFPFEEDEKYLLKLKNGEYVIARWSYSKFYLYYEPTHLGKIHGHVLTLGFIGMLLLYLLTGNMSNEQLQKLKHPIYVMESGLVFTVVNMFVLGVHEIVSLIVEALDMNRNTINMSALNGMSGLGHILLSVGLIWTLVKVFNIEKLIETK